MEERMTRNKKGVYTKSLVLNVTPEMHQFVKLLAARQDTTMNDVIRQAVREHLDVQEGVIGSRSRLGRTVIAELGAIRNELVQRLDHMSTLLLAAVILQQIQRGESGSRVMEQITKLAHQIEDRLPEARQ
jgi:hypothetical protein